MTSFKEKIKNKINLGWLLIMLALVAIMAAGCNASSSEKKTAPQVASLAPDFALSTFSGEKVTLSDLRGRVVLVNFWASWCPACREETPALEASWRVYKDKGVVFLGVDLQEDRETVAKYAEEFGITFSLPLDSDGKVSERYLIGTRGLPTTYFIDGEGVIRYVKVGPMTQDFIAARLDSLLQGVASKKD
ncbi:MAG: TlpA family protein disulfide reductase [Chloroflexi bacterium]|nr:TlpA family protein disulfide reductase [Chloroflexota bacterium]